MKIMTFPKPRGFFPLLVLFASLHHQSDARQSLQIASLGDFTLESGAVLRDCRLGYRTCGRLNESRSNVILFPSWFGGTSENLLGDLGTGKVVDTSSYFVILVDALGNGVSSSPSNSPTQPDSLFPEVTIRDMVAVEHLLLANVFHLSDLYAVVGISMGGMQAFQWSVTYPGSMKVVIPIVGSPRLAPYDLLLWNTDIRIIEECLRSHCGEPAYLIDLAQSLTVEPGRFASLHPRDSVDSYLAGRRRADAQNYRPFNRLVQLRAMIGHDISHSFGGSMEKAARAVRSRMLIITATTDRIVTPAPAREFAALLGCTLLDIKTDCGHGVLACEMPRVSNAVAEFLESR